MFTILLIATLCNPMSNQCHEIVLDEWQSYSLTSPQGLQDQQADCVFSKFEAFNVNVKSFECYKVVFEDDQAFTVQSLTTGQVKTLFHAAKEIENY